MSNKDVDSGFWNRADELIDLANKQCGTMERGKVSASMLYAAARFNTFLVASSFKDQAMFKEKKKEAIDYYSAQYRKMLEENYDDYINSFQEYVLD